jgi:hypothetical protein
VVRDAIARQFDVDKNSVEMNQKTGAITFLARKGRSIYLEKLFANLQATRMNGPTGNHLVSFIVTATGEVALADNELALKVAGTAQRFVLDTDPKALPRPGEKAAFQRLKEALADGKTAVEVTGRVRGWEGRFTGFMKALPDAAAVDPRSQDRPAVFQPRLLVSDFKLLQK